MPTFRLNDVTPGPQVKPLRAQDAPESLTYTTGAVAKICGVSQNTIIRCFDNGLITGFRVPGSKFRRVTRKGLFLFMVSNGIPLDALEPLTEWEREKVTEWEKSTLPIAPPVGPKLADVDGGD